MCLVGSCLYNSGGKVSRSVLYHAWWVGLDARAIRLEEHGLSCNQLNQVSVTSATLVSILLHYYINTSAIDVAIQIDVPNLALPSLDFGDVTNSLSLLWSCHLNVLVSYIIFLKQGIPQIFSFKERKRTKICRRKKNCTGTHQHHHHRHRPISSRCSNCHCFVISSLESYPGCWLLLVIDAWEFYRWILFTIRLLPLFIPPLIMIYMMSCE